MDETEATPRKRRPRTSDAAARTSSSPEVRDPRDVTGASAGPGAGAASEASETSAPDLVDPAMAGTVPQTERGRRTRAAIVAAARRVFERDGYLDSRLVDIAAEASCSVGSLYTWFEGKDEVLAAVLLEAQHEMLHPGTPRFASSDDPVALIQAANRAYVEAYARNAALNRLLDQVAVVDERFHRMRMVRADAFVRRNARAIRDLQERGLADRGVDAEIASLALSGMVSRLAQSLFVHGLDAPVDDVVDVATRLWTNALGLTTPDLRPSGPGSV